MSNALLLTMCRITGKMERIVSGNCSGCAAHLANPIEGDDNHQTTFTTADTDKLAKMMGGRVKNFDRASGKCVEEEDDER